MHMSGASFLPHCFISCWTTWIGKRASSLLVWLEISSCAGMKTIGLSFNLNPNAQKTKIKHYQAW